MSLYFLGLLLVAALCAALLRWAGAGPGSRALGGIMAGVLLGPTIFGAMAPLQYRHIVIGGADAWEAKRILIRRHEADLLAMKRGMADQSQFAGIQRQHALELEEAERKRQVAQDEHQCPMLIGMMALVSLAILAGGAIAVRDRDQRQTWASPISIGAWAAAVPGGLAFAAARWWWDWPTQEAAFLAAAVAIGPLVLTKIDCEAANEAEFGGARMIQTAGRIAILISLAIAIASAAMQSPSMALIVLVPLGMMVLGWMTARFVNSPTRRRRIEQLSDWFLIPGVAASAAAAVDLNQDFAAWPLIVIAVLSADGRWLGALIGALLPGGRRGFRTMRLVMGSMAAGSSQLVMAAIAGHFHFVPHSGVTALLAGALIIEFSVRARRAFAVRLAEIEEQV